MGPFSLAPSMGPGPFFLIAFPFPLSFPMNHLDHAIATLLWSESDDNGQPLDRLGAELSPEARRRIETEWAEFSAKAEALGFDALEHRATMLPRDCDADHWAAVAHDWALTRNRHGAGFWDGDWVEPWGRRLTDLAHKSGEISLYLGDDGLIYAC